MQMTIAVTENEKMKIREYIYLQDENGFFHFGDEIIRCKDCKHMKYAIDKGKNGMCGIHGALIIMSGNDYCSYGERKEK